MPPEEPNCLVALNMEMRGEDTVISGERVRAWENDVEIVSWYTATPEPPDGYESILGGLVFVRSDTIDEQCTNNLKQLGLGVHNYESTNGVLPPPFVLGIVSGTTLNGNDWRAHARVLPYIEQNTTFNAMNLSLQYSLAKNLTVSRLPVSGFLCPSEIKPAPRTDATTGEVVHGVNNYGWNPGDWLV